MNPLPTIEYHDAKRIHRCPFCDNVMTLVTFFIDPPHILDPNIQGFKALAHCPFCMTNAETEHVLRPGPHTDILDLTGSMRSAVIESMNRQIEDIKGTGAYELYLSDREDYKRKYGREMPIWYGICSDYALMGREDIPSAPKDHEEILEKLNDPRILFTKEQVRTYLDSIKNRRVEF